MEAEIKSITERQSRTGQAMKHIGGQLAEVKMYKWTEADEEMGCSWY